MVKIVAEVEVVHVVAVLIHVCLVLDKTALIRSIDTCAGSDTIYPTVVSGLSSYNIWRSETLGGFIIVRTEDIMLINYNDIAILASGMYEDLKLPTYILNGEKLLKITIGPIGIPCSPTRNSIE